MAISLLRLVSGLTVRTRIVVLAAIPLFGFLANGTAFTTGQAEVEDAFDSVKHATTLAEASQDLKNALGGMRILVRDFAAQPGPGLIQIFDEIHRASLNNLLRIETDAHESVRQEVEGLRQRIGELKTRFSHLVSEQSSLGFTEDDGIRKRMRNSATAVERVINEDMAWITKTDSQKLLVSLLIMRRYESDYRLTRLRLARSEFFDELKTFNEALGAIIAAEVMKDGLSREVRTYADTFAEWIESTNTVSADVASMDIELRQLMPVTDDIIASARFNAVSAATALTASQSRTNSIIILVGCAAVLIGLGFSWLIGRSITRPLNGLAGAMTQLAAGDTAARIPATRASDEIGAMARTVIVFRDTMIEREHLAGEQIAAARARAARRRHYFDHRLVPQLGAAGARQIARRRRAARTVGDQAQQRRGRRRPRRAAPKPASTPLRTTSPRRPARSRNWRRRSARSRAKPPNRPTSRAARYRRRSAPSRP